MSAYISLEDAAKQLGVATDQLIDLRSQGLIRGFRDGASWKFPEAEIARMKEELPNLSGFGSGILASGGGGSKLGSVIGGDPSLATTDGGSGSDIELGVEGKPGDGGSDVNLVPSEGTDSDVAVVVGSANSGPSGSDAPLAIDLDDLELSGSAISHDSGAINNLADSDEFNLGSALDLTGKQPPSDDPSNPTPAIGKAASDSGMALDDSGDALGNLADLAGDSDPNLDLGSVSLDDNASSLELMDSLDLSDAPSSIASRSSAGADVLSELDLLAGEAAGSGLLSGDSGNLLGSSLVKAGDGGSSGVDDALADDDDLIIADDDDDLVVSSAGSDISIAGDSGINLMSPSDSGLSLESEPLDLAGSSISALDLGAELGEGSGAGSSRGSRSGLVPGDGSGSAVDFQADEEFQLSPSGIQLERSEESGSQVIAIEESEAFEAEEVSFDNDDGFGGGGGFAGGFDDANALADGGLDDPMALDGGGMEEDALAVGTTATAAAGAGMMMGGYEVPFTLLQTLGMLMILIVMSLGGMLMTDLVRNMWAYSETSAPVSALTDALIGLMGMN